jgi:3-dehydroquinate dehydratase-2
MTMTVLVLNGPNLARLGSREPDVYGTADYDDLVTACTETAKQCGVQVDVRQSDDESELVGWLHEAADSKQPVVLNPAAFTHYSYSLRDAVAIARDSGCAVVEVHLTNPAAREAFRQTSVVAGVASGTIAGFGLGSYRLAIRSVAAAP